MLLDRKLQLDILNKMASVYPLPYNFGSEIATMDEAK